jgi:Uma2 family endonuclease
MAPLNAIAPEKAAVPRRVDLESSGAIMTPAEFDAIEDYDECYCYELIHGVLVVTPIPSEAEVDPNEELGHLLRAYRDQHPQGTALNKTLPERYVRTRDSRRRADRVIWAGLGRVPNPKVDIPTIVVELVSAGKRNRQRDYVEKRREYIDLGVKEYWLIDRFDRTMSVFAGERDAPTERIVREKETYITPLLPGFKLPLARLFGVADDWK